MKPANPLKITMYLFCFLCCSTVLVNSAWSACNIPNVPNVPSECGEWGEPFGTPATGIHGALLPTEKVLIYSKRFDVGTPTPAYTWDPQTNEFCAVFLDPHIFCSGISFLPDGMLFITGGTAGVCSGTSLGSGSPAANGFDVRREEWVRIRDMNEPRWYPTNIPLGNGQTLVASGSDSHCQLSYTFELFDPRTGLFEAFCPENFCTNNVCYEDCVDGKGTCCLNWGLYPPMYLLTSGKVAYASEYGDAHLFDVRTRSWDSFHATSHVRFEQTSCLVPGFPDRILVVGGIKILNGVPVTHDITQYIDFQSHDPAWSDEVRLTHRRANANAVILPDGTVMAVGGNINENGVEQAVLEPELYDPQTNSWRDLKSQHYTRDYHSIALLLPDGRVFSSGTDDYELSHYTSEVYSPPYLFRGPRPRNPSVYPPQEPIRYHQLFPIIVQDAEKIRKVVLIAPGAVTHGLNTTQRYVDLQFSMLTSSTLLAVSPPNGDHAPPGYYMMFVVNDNGIPSEATWVVVGD